MSSSVLQISCKLLRVFKNAIRPFVSVFPYMLMYSAHWLSLLILVYYQFYVSSLVRQTKLSIFDCTVNVAYCLISCCSIGYSVKSTLDKFLFL